MIVIGDLRAADSSRCAALDKLLFPDDTPWSAAAFRQEMKRPEARYLAARRDGEVIGYAGLALLGPADDPEAEVLNIGVAPEHQGQGCGGLLFSRLLEIADARHAPVFLEVRVDNDAAIGLYRRHGFVPTGVRKNYYRPSGRDALTMRREAVA